MPERSLLVPGETDAVRPCSGQRPEPPNQGTALGPGSERPSGGKRHRKRHAKVEAVGWDRRAPSGAIAARASIHWRFRHVTHHMPCPSCRPAKVSQKTARVTIFRSCLFLHHVDQGALEAAAFVSRHDWNCRLSMQLSRREMIMLHRKSTAAARLAGGIKCGSTEATMTKCGTISCRFGAHGGSLYGRQKRNGNGQR